MDCQDAKQMLEPCARGDLDATDRAELDRHVATCEGCRLELELTRAVLGSSSSSSIHEPSFHAPEDAAPTPTSVASIEREPSIELERLPEPPDEGPVPPRVLTSQLPEDTEETLNLESLHAANAYDPGAIDLPLSGPGESFGEGVPADSPSPSPSAENLSFADLASDSGPQSPAKPTATMVASTAGGSGAGGNWGFEPVDVPRAAAPPEESLSFAKEALDRKRGKSIRNQKGARLLLWAGGAVGGVGLLAVSVWMALAFRDVPVGHDPSNLPAVQPPPGAQPDGPAPADSMARPGADSGIMATDSIAAPVPGVLRAGATGSGALPGIDSPRATAPRTSAGSSPDPARVSGTQSAPGKTTEGASRTPKPAESSAPVAFREDELAPAPRREPQILRQEPDAPPGSEPGFESQPDPSVPKAPTKSVSTSPIFVPPGSSTKSSTGTAAKQPSEDASPTGPIGRLHTATVTAEKNGDLEALRKLKEPWRSLIRSTTGAERNRSKREYADCLWAIQEITNRDADRKEALTAYREYVLHAPAGGADARTVSRMRHLEDILSDPQ
ncbi:MAG TPA: zf-HC2 domain-containing protein [Candidatus Eisenbacteria bacterium]|nr:zf-HC2 domain-containing protein [Candidatus Eisenbacteria bacterium]